MKILIALGVIFSLFADRLLARAPDYINPKTGEIYEGQLKNGLPDGHGRLFNPTRKKTYIGEFKNGLRHGFGEAIFEDPRDERYSIRGEWKNGMPDGDATMRLRNGHIYSGNYSKGWMQGDFLHVSARGVSTLETFDRSIKVRVLETYSDKVFSLEKNLHGLALNHISARSRLYKLGYRNGDRIMMIGEENLTKDISADRVNEMIPKIFHGQATRVIRGGEDLTLGTRGKAPKSLQNHDLS